jgi:hypothetical protein
MLILQEMLESETGRVWMTQEATPRSAAMKCPELQMTLVFDSSRMGMQIDLFDNKEVVEFDKLAAIALATIIGRFDLRTFTRVGHRTLLLLPTNSLEEAEALSLQAAPSREWPAATVNELLLTQAEAASVFENAERSRSLRFKTDVFYRVGAPVEIDERLKQNPRTLSKEQNRVLVAQLKLAKQRADEPVAGLMFDVDYAWNSPVKWVASDFFDESQRESQAAIEAFLAKVQV